MRIGSSPSPRRILFVEHNVDGTVGGSHYCLLDICRNLDRARFEPLVLFFQENSLSDAFRDSGTEVIVGSPGSRTVQWSNDRRGNGFRPLAALQSAINAALMLVVRPLQWIRFIRRHRIDIVHLNNSFNSNHDLILAAWVMRVPCIAHQRGVPGVTGRSEVWFGRRLTRIIAISSFIRDDLLERGLPAGKLLLIHDGIDPARTVARRSASELRGELGISPNQRVVGIVGNVKAWKGQHVFVDAMAIVAARYAEVRGLIVGAPAETEYLANLREAVRRHGLDTNVTFAGYQRHPADFMAIMNVVVHASVDPEPFGIVITEAMAMGKPVVAAALGGPLDIVQDGVTGFLTPVGDAEALARRILELLDDPDVAKQFGTAGRRRFLENFSISKGVLQIERLYDEMIAARSGAQSAP